jgi:PAS domain-containing protein
MSLTPVTMKAVLYKEKNMGKKKSEKTYKNKTGSQNPANLRKREKVALQEKVEETLRESEERFRLLCEAAEEGIIIHDNGVIIEANEAIARMFGYELSEMIGRDANPGVTSESWKVRSGTY